MTEKENDTMNFRPITEGLGFHPFSNGLPYEPSSKAGQSPSPNSATKRPLPTSSAKSSHPPKSMTLPLGQSITNTGMSKERMSPKGVSASTSISTTPLKERSLKNLTYPSPAAAADNEKAKTEVQVPTWVLVDRFVAYSIDLTLMTLVALSTISIGLFRANIDPMLFAKKEFILALGLYAFFFSWALITAQEIIFSTSIGKRMFRISIHGDPSKLFFRSVGFLLSISLFGLGLWSGFLSKRKLCFHDILSKIAPVRVPVMKKA